MFEKFKKTLIDYENEFKFDVFTNFYCCRFHVQNNIR